jgi:hypothetical protein
MEFEDIVQEAKQEIESFRAKNPDGVVVIR